MPIDRERHALDRRRQERLRRGEDRRRTRLTRHDDSETRRRLLEVSAHLFAEHGQDGVTVREICRGAGANVAAINYHFGDKMGLYAEVVGLAIEAMRRAHAPSMRPADESAEERLGWYIRSQLERFLQARDDSWVFRLMRNEAENPTPGLDRMVREVIRPRMDYVAGIVAELMHCPPDDPRIGTVVANIQGLPMLLGRRSILARLLPDWKPTAEKIGKLANETTRFVLGGIHALAEAGPRGRGR